ncbi:MAG: FAD-dependent oxidoreductase [Cyclobacteriaceae bacterium]
MDRRNFLNWISASGIGMAAFPHMAFNESPIPNDARELKADLVIAGGGLGGFAAAMAALRNGMQVILTEETDWIGGQITQQWVPSDEHQWLLPPGTCRMEHWRSSGIVDCICQKKENSPQKSQGKQKITNSISGFYPASGD